MKAPRHDHAHLTYCTNIHPGESWAEVRENLERFVVPVKERVYADGPFGVGLRLSGRAATELEDPGAFEELEAFLAARDLYVFTINGFPHGSFHGTRVKENVYRPDWLEEERLDYTNRLARLLARLMPADASFEGSVSTVPVGFRPRVTGTTALENAAERLLRHAAYLHELADTTGRTIALALEPEPCCRLETTEEAVSFFESRLLGKRARDRMAELADVDTAAAERIVRRHIGVCFDACHAAVQFEDATQSLASLRRAGLRVVKAQLSTGLAVVDVDATKRAQLTAFADDVYLHQVVERDHGTLKRYLDLSEAIEAVGSRPIAPEEWRVHFHVPLFRRNLGSFENTQPLLAALLDEWKATPFTDHLEVETYSWEMLPAEYRDEDVVDSVARELSWVVEHLNA